MSAQHRRNGTRLKSKLTRGACNTESDLLFPFGDVGQSKTTRVDIATVITGVYNVLREGQVQLASRPRCDLADRRPQKICNRPNFCTIDLKHGFYEKSSQQKLEGLKQDKLPSCDPSIYKPLKGNELLVSADM